MATDPDDKELKRIEQLEARRAQKEGIDEVIRSSKEVARLASAQYNAFKKENFSDEQAIRLTSDYIKSLFLPR